MITFIAGVESIFAAASIALACFSFRNWRHAKRDREEAEQRYNDMCRWLELSKSQW